MAVAGNTTPQINLLHGLTPVSSSITANWHAAAANICVVGAAGVRYKVHSLIVDISALVGNFTPGMFISVNGVQKQIFPPVLATTFIIGTNSPALALINGTYGIANALTIKGFSDNVADNGAAIGFEYFLEAM